MNGREKCLKDEESTIQCNSSLAQTSAPLFFETWTEINDGIKLIMAPFGSIFETITLPFPIR